VFKKVLIANRGEIALRIIRACRELGIKTVAVFSEFDRDSLHVRFADEAICIGPAAPNESYLNIPRIISAAEITNVDAIHPGYGFLAENYHFAEVCESCDIKFVGPSAEVIGMMGEKVLAKKAMKKAKVPVLPGSDSTIKDWKKARNIAKDIGYPIILKAVAGGGGRGMRIIYSPDEMEKSFITAQSEAETSFGNPALYMEKYFGHPRPVEVQIFGDEYDNIVQMGERDCSIQRRYQKLVEESPCPILPENIRKELCQVALNGAKAVNYSNAGTMEFLLDDNMNFYFMEMNTRIQVEHTVTEVLVGRDLVKEQIRIAAGEKLGYSQKDITFSGHVIECRINAEDPENGFLPSPGQISSLHIPGGPGIRVDTHVYARYIIPTFYDSLLAKVVTHGRDRSESIGRMERALEELIFEGIKTTIPFQQKVIANPAFRNGTFNTEFLNEEMNNGYSGKSVIHKGT